MRNTTRSTRSVRLNWLCGFAVASFMIACMVAVVNLADPPDDPPLKVLKMGLGTGRITTTDGRINCSGTSPVSDCEAGYASTDFVTITAVEDPGVSVFAGWEEDPDKDGPSPDCVGMTNPCGPLQMNVARSVRAVFNPATDITSLTTAELTPRGIKNYLDANSRVDTVAEFIKALPGEFKLNWILMSRSESLQTGTAQSPRILLPSADGRLVFTTGMTEHSSYPGSHPDAIEFMQWDPDQKNFRFHEIVLNTIRRLDPDGDGYGVIEERRRNVFADDAKCPACHSTRNVPSLNRTDVTTPVTGSVPGTDGYPRPGTVAVKNKPNWDPYDSWPGMMPFNRDRIYQGSVEAAAFRKLFNPWTWRTNEPIRQIIEQLRLQPPGVPSVAPRDHRIFRKNGGPDDGHIRFGFDPVPPAPLVFDEPAPSSTSSPITTAYSFDRAMGTGTPTSVTRGGTFLTLHHTYDVTNDQGRGVRFFDLLGGQGENLPGPDGPRSNLNAQRVASEINTHQFATGSVPVEIRPLALAIATGCFRINGTSVEDRSTPTRALNLPFFNGRNGLNIEELVRDTRSRTQSLPRRKADTQRMNLDRLHVDGSPDPYLSTRPTPTPSPFGLLQQYPPTPTSTPDISPTRLRQEVFRRLTNPTADLLCSGILCSDHTVMGNIYVDREHYFINTDQVALYRYFLEPLGVSVDKWSTGVRGRSRTYAFADVFNDFENTLIHQIGADLRPGMRTRPIPGLTPSGTADASGARRFQCSDLMPFVESTLGSLPPPAGPDAIPKYTDVQRIFNKSCIECHGGLDYPPYGNVIPPTLDISEDENPTAVDRLNRSHALLISMYVSADPATSRLYRRITDYGSLTHPYNPVSANELCPGTLMPCGGPPLSKADIETVRRWIIGTGDPAVGVGVHPNTRGDPHIQTVNGVAYDFQSAGEFVLLRGQNFELQARQTAVGTEGPLRNDHTGLDLCVSINTAAAVKVGPHRITYQPNASGEPDPSGLQLRIDGKLTPMRPDGIALDGGGRIMPTSVTGGIAIEAPGGTTVNITPNFWHHYQVWYVDIDVSHGRATEGVMGTISSGEWLPALPDGTRLGGRPDEPHLRYVTLYDRFENAWRVTNASSLFDYAPGTSTSTYTVDSWPAENPQTCTAPPRAPGGPLDRKPLPTLGLEAAQQLCAGIVRAPAKANCIKDVMVTGDAIFAQGYQRAEQVELNARPKAPVLGLPEDRKTDVATATDFTWTRTSDLNGDSLKYRHCIWEATERFTFNKCAALPDSGVSMSWWRGGLWHALLVLLFGLLLLAILLWLGFRRKPVFLYLVVVIIMVGVGVAFYLGRKRSQTALLAKSVSSLQSGKAYYWKVIAEDGKGGTTESETRRFEVK